MKPLVSVICVTKDRTEFLPRLLAQWKKQDWANRELVIVNGGAPIEQFVPVDKDVRVFDVDGPISRALNAGVDAARGDIIVRFDDDDWQAADRISSQVDHLRITRKSVVGSMQITFWDKRVDYALRILDRMNHSAGAALAFRRDWALAHPFTGECGYPEDTAFVHEAMRHNEFSNISGLDMLVMETHAGNDSQRRHDILPRELIAMTDNYQMVALEEISHICQ